MAFSFLMGATFFLYSSAVKAFEPKVINTNSNLSLKYGTNVVFVDTTTTSISITLPVIGNGSGKAGLDYEVYIKDTAFSASTHNITISPSSTNKIDNDTSFTIDDDGGFVRLKSDGLGNWLVSGDNRVRRINQIFSLPFANTIDGKTTGAINVFKVPQGKKAVFLGADIALKNKTGTVMAVGSGKFQVAGGVDLTSDASLTGVTTVGSLAHYSPFSAGVGAGTVIVGGAGGTWIQFNLTGAYTATSATLSGSIQGYLLN